MTQDFARRGNLARSGGLPGWVWFLTGLASGIFASFLFYLWHNVPTDPNATAVVEKPGMEIKTGKKSDDMKWDFYNLFSTSKVPVVESYGKDGQKTEVDQPEHFIIQAGAFKTAGEADRQRAQLILLGMEPFIKVVTKDGVTWHRVMLGPVNSRLEMERDRRKLANANIPSLAFHVSQ